MSAQCCIRPLEADDAKPGSWPHIPVRILRAGQRGRSTAGNHRAWRDGHHFDPVGRYGRWTLAQRCTDRCPQLQQLVCHVFQCMGAGCHVFDGTESFAQTNAWAGCLLMRMLLLLPLHPRDYPRRSRALRWFALPHSCHIQRMTHVLPSVAEWQCSPCHASQKFKRVYDDAVDFRVETTDELPEQKSGDMTVHFGIWVDTKSCWFDIYGFSRTPTIIVNTVDNARLTVQLQ